MDEITIKVLKALQDEIKPGQRLLINFCAFSKVVGVSEKDLDHSLNQLENQRFLNQWIIGSTNNFLVELL